MLTFNQIYEKIEYEISKQKFDRKPYNLYKPLEYALSLGGKRLRPAMLLMTCNMFEKNIEKAIPAAFAIEMMHNFTLIHDDIMDKAPIRRGKVTVYKKWNESIAILSGDAMLIKSYQLINSVKTKKIKQIIDIFSKAALEICEGQQFDIDFEEFDDVEIKEYLNMISLKTSVLFGASSQIGGLIGGADEETCEKLYDFGLNFGLAFQLQDDYLDSFGDEKTFGKTIGGDIISNKKTYLLIKALELAKEDLKVELNSWINKKNFEKGEKIKAVKQIYLETRANLEILKEIRVYFEKAKILLNIINVSQENKQEFLNIINKLENREK